MKRNRRVKIIATLGPSSNDQQTIQRLFQAGADVFRINMSHASHDIARDLHGAIRRTEEKCGRPIGILADLQGPKLRIGAFTDEKVQLSKGQQFQFDLEDQPGNSNRIYLPHHEIFKSVEPGHLLILDDGKQRMRVTDIAPGKIMTKVLVDGSLSSRKGISLPDTILPFSAMSDKDRSDLEFVLGLGVDWVALSFVQRAQDVAEARRIAGAPCGNYGKNRKTIRHSTTRRNIRASRWIDGRQR